MMLTFEIGDRGNRINVFTSDNEHKNKEGDEYTADSKSLLYNRKRILPVMGEFHYSRWEDDTWEEELRKMKTGGINIVATYLFWIHHEEKENEWNFRAEGISEDLFSSVGRWVCRCSFGLVPGFMLRCGMEDSLTGYSVQRIMNQEQMTKDILRQLKSISTSLGSSWRD